MKKILFFLIGIIVLSTIFFFYRDEIILYEEQARINSQASNRSLRDKAPPPVPEKNAAPGSSLPNSEAPVLLTEETAPASNQETDILLVNARHILPWDYKPAELINLYEQSGRHFQLASRDIKLCEPVFYAMEDMFSSAMEAGVGGFIITSGYRSHDKQAEIFANIKDGTAARPGTSEHETGLAFDVTAYGNEDFGLTPQFEWLSMHCGEYGFIIRYPKGKEYITGCPYEPWHYRYVGTPHAKEIMDRGITLEEYLEQL